MLPITSPQKLMISLHICAAHRGWEETLCFSARTWQEPEARLGGVRPVLSWFEASICLGVSMEMREAGVFTHPCHTVTSSYNLGSYFPSDCSSMLFPVCVWTYGGSREGLAAILLLWECLTCFQPQIWLSQMMIVIFYISGKKS